MKKPKLIMLYGFASSGKTTLAKKYMKTPRCKHYPPAKQKKRSYGQGHNFFSFALLPAGYL